MTIRFIESRSSATFGAIVLLWLSRTSLSLVVIYPLLLALRTSGMVSGPDGDAVLYRAGALELLELFRGHLPLLGAAFKLTLIGLALAALAELAVLAVAIDLLFRHGNTLRERAHQAVALFPRFVGLGGIVLLAQAATLLGASLLGAALKAALGGADDRVLTLIPSLVFGLGLVACGGIGCLLDLARVSLVQRREGLQAALRSAATSFHRNPVRVVLGASLSVVGAAAAYLGAACLTLRFDFAANSKLTLASAFVVHQLAALCALYYRVRWLSTALELNAASALRPEPITESAEFAEGR